MKVSQAGTGGECAIGRQDLRIGVRPISNLEEDRQLFTLPMQFQIAHALLLSKLHRFKGPI